MMSLMAALAQRTQTEEALQALNQTLEAQVMERTRTLDEQTQETVRSNLELSRFNRVAVGREGRIMELKRKVNELSEKLGQAPPYDLSFAEKVNP